MVAVAVVVLVLVIASPASTAFANASAEAAATAAADAAASGVNATATAAIAEETAEAATEIIVAVFEVEGADFAVSTAVCAAVVAATAADEAADESTVLSIFFSAYRYFVGTRHNQRTTIEFFSSTHSCCNDACWKFVQALYYLDAVCWRSVCRYFRFNCEKRTVVQAEYDRNCFQRYRT